MEVPKINSYSKLKPDAINRYKSKLYTKPVSKTVKGACLAGLMILGAIGMAGLKNNKQNINNTQTANYVNNEDFSNTYGRYGDYYLNNVPDIENINEHKSLINELSALSEENQGCKITNPAYLNGLSAEEIQKKAITPAQKIANNIRFGEGENTLALIGFETGLDDKSLAFEKDFQKNNFSSNSAYLGGVTPINFDKSFFDNYDNIILIQPNKQNSDKTLDTIFEKLYNTMDKGANLDIAIVGHSTEVKDGIRLSKGNNEKSALDVSDFNPTSAGGNSYAQNIRKIFLNSMENDYNPKIIGLGCNSEFLQDCMNKIFSEEDLGKVKVFGTPSEIMDTVILGFNNQKLNVHSLTKSIRDDIGLVINISEDQNLQAENNKNVKDFKLNQNIKNEIYMDYMCNNQTSGTLTKNGNMIMEYQLMRIR